jgi:3-oxoacyl-[acyl-carrier protein] reductase
MSAATVPGRCEPAFAGIAGRHALVTGASQGIGRAVASALADCGARVSVIARRREILADLVAAIGGADEGHGFVACDLTAPESPQVALVALQKRAGPVDIVVHAVGGSLQLDSLISPVEDWSKVWQLNVGQAIALNNAVLPGMTERGWGRIVHFSSRAAVEFGGAAPYAAAKAYLNAYVTILGRACAPTGVLINGIMASAIAAEGNSWWRAVRSQPERVSEFLAEHQTIGRLGSPDDLLPFVLLLASSDNRFAAGSMFSIDGGSK